VHGKVRSRIEIDISGFIPEMTMGKLKKRARGTKQVMSHKGQEM
jgi:hypothetical protein